MDLLRIRVKFLGFMMVLFWGGQAYANLPGAGDAVRFSPSLDWVTLTTPHFRINYPNSKKADLSPIARQTAQYFERAHALLSSELKWQSATRTEVLLLDNSDAANGLTMPALRVGIVLYLTPPDSWFSTTYYDDWLWLLVVHEYTHFLNIDATTDLWQALRYVFGDAILPNQALPTWMLEGLAVYMETKYTALGRGRSPYYEMVLRQAVESDSLNTRDGITLDRLGGQYPYYPGGEVPYLFGYEMMRQVGEGTKGSLGELSLRSAGRVPFFINGNLENVTGRDWYFVWGEWVGQTKSRMNVQLAKINSESLSPTHKLTDGAFQTLGSSLSPDGKQVAFVQSTMDSPAGLWLLSADGKADSQKPTRLLSTTLSTSISFSPDGSSLFFSSLHLRGDTDEFSDLGWTSIDNPSAHWLTSGARAKDPDVSEDGKWIAFTVAEDARVGLAIAALMRDADSNYKLGTIEKIYWPEPLGRVAQPKFSKGKNSGLIYFSLHKNGKSGEDIYQYDLNSRRATVLVEDGHFNRYVSVSPSGELYYVSDASGVDNIYRYADRARITNVSSGVVLPAVGRENIYFGQYFKSGWDFVHLKMQDLQSFSAKSAIQFDGARYPRNEELGSQFKDATESQITTRSYSALPSLAPRYWSPYFGADGVDTVFGGAVGGFDAADYHRYLLGLEYLVPAQTVNTSVAYENRMWWPTLALSFTQLGDPSPVSAVYSAKGNQRMSAGLSHSFYFDRLTIVPSLEYASDVTGSSVGSRRIGLFTGSFALVSGESSRLAVVQESGHRLNAAVRSYQDVDQDVYKAAINDATFLNLGSNIVATQQLRTAYSSNSLPRYLDGSVNVSGARSMFLSSLSGLAGNSDLDTMDIRGYPNFRAYAKSVFVVDLKLDFPIVRPHRGWGTNPFYLSQVSGFSFAELADFRLNTWVSTDSKVYNLRQDAYNLVSLGAGIKIDTQIFALPLIVLVTATRGLNSEFGGTGQLTIEAGSPWMVF